MVGSAGGGTLGGVDGDVEAAAADTWSRTMSGGTVKGEDDLLFCGLCKRLVGRRGVCCGADELGLEGTSIVLEDSRRVIDFRGCSPGRFAGEDGIVRNTLVAGRSLFGD